MEDIKKLRNIIIIMFVFIILIIILILILNKQFINNNTIEKNDILEEAPEILSEENNNGFSKLDDYSMFFTVLNSFNNYIDVLTYNINEEDTIEENPYWIRSEEDRKKIIFSMLDENYKKENNIVTAQDIVIEKSNGIYSVIPIEIKVKYSDKIQVYALDVYIENVNDKTLSEEFYILKMDSYNSTFSIRPMKNCNSIDDIKQYDELQNIKYNDYNKYYMETMTDEAVAKSYMQRYKYMILNYPQIFYDKYLEDNYREKRFANIQKFIEYVEENKDEISEVKAVKYTKNNYIDYNEFIIIDQNNNYYIFKEKSLMNFTLKLDNYTIPTDNFKTEYKKASEEKKVQMNIDKFIQMINRHDYISSYNCISEGFRNNYFDTQEKFENYIKNNFFSYNKFEFKNFEKKGSNVYVYSVVLTDLTGENAETNEISIIMQLSDDLDFEMSFAM